MFSSAVRTTTICPRLGGASRPAGTRACIGTLAATATLALTGCASYERRPIDEAAHWQAFQDRYAALAAETLSPPTDGRPDPARADRGLDLRDGLDPAEGEISAVLFNGALRIARARAGVSLAGADHAGLWRDPVVGLDIMRMLEGGMNPWEVMASVGFEIPISGRLAFERAMARAAHDVSLARLAAEEWRVRLDVREAWARWSAAEQERTTLAQLIEGMESLVTTVEAMEEAGEATGIQAGLFRAELIARRAEHARAAGEAEAMACRVLAACGLPPQARVHLSSDDARPSDVPADFEAGMAQARERNPGLAVARAEHEEAERSLALAVREGRPDLEIMPGFGREEGNDRVALGLAMPLPIFNGNRRAIAEAEAQRELSRAMFEMQAESLAGELSEAFAQWQGARMRAAMVRERLVPQTAALEDAARQVARLGEVDLVLLLEALSRRQDAELMRIEAERDEHLAALQIARLIGPASPEAPSPAAPLGTEAPTPEGGQS